MMAAHWKQAMRMQSGGVPRVAANGTCHAPPGSSGSNKSVDLALLASLSDGGCPYGFVNPFGVVCWWRFRARFALCPVPSVLVLRDVG